jgi:predicted  nucleic acid-binding Zn-ribbon protein
MIGTIMEEVKNWLDALLELQDTDGRLSRMKEQVENAPKQKKEAQDNLDMQQQQAVLARDEVRKVELAISELNAEIEKIEAQRTKLLEQSGSVKDNNTYRAMLAEIESFAKQISDKETAELELMEELDLKKDAFKECQGRLKEAIGRVEQMMGDLDTRVGNYKKQIAVYEEKRLEQAAEVDEELLKKYSRIRTSHGKKRDALVEINGDKCGYCHLTLTTQEINQAKKRSPMTTCGNCGTLIYS